MQNNFLFIQLENFFFHKSVMMSPGMLCNYYATGNIRNINPWCCTLSTINITFLSTTKAIPKLTTKFHVVNMWGTMTNCLERKFVSYLSKPAVQSLTSTLHDPMANGTNDYTEKEGSYCCSNSYVHHLGSVQKWNCGNWRNWKNYTKKNTSMDRIIF